MQHADNLLRGSLLRPSFGSMRPLLPIAAALTLTACGGGSDAPPAPTAPTTFTIGGTVSGLGGSGLVLQNNAANNLPVAANGPFTFTASMNSGAAYAVTVSSQPTTPMQTCNVTNGAGTVTNSNVTNVVVACSTNTYTVSATVSGLAGTGLVLQNNAGNNLAVAANGVVTFTTPVASGMGYAVTVSTQPTTPSQNCVVTNGTGTITSNNVTNVAIACTTNSFAVNAMVSGLAGTGLVLQNSGGSDLTINANGSSAFSPTIISGGAYDVRVLTHPAAPNQRCTVTNGRGTIGNGPATATVSCVTQVPRFAYSIDRNNSSLSIYGVEASTGLLRPRGYVNTGVTPSVMATDPQQRFWFALSTGAATLSVYRHDDVTGALSEVAGSPYPTGGTPGGSGPVSLAMHPSGAFIYVVNFAGTNNIAAFAINPNSGVLTAVPGSPFAAGTEPLSLTIDAIGAFAYVTNRASNNIYTFSIAASGALTEVANSRVTTGATPGGLIIHGNGRLAYVPNVGGNSISAFTIHPTTGVLTPVANSPFAAGTNPATAAYLHPSGRYLYLRNANVADANGSISAYSINQASGALTTLGSAAPIGPNSVRMVADPAGRFLFVTNQGVVGTNGSVSQYRIDAATGALTALTGVPTWPGRPYGVTVDPSGQYLYMTSVVLNTHYAYSLNSTTGALTALNRGPRITGRDFPTTLNVYSSISTPTAATFSSTRAYVTNATTPGSVSAYQANGSGALSLIENAAFGAMLQPTAAAMYANGAKILVANRGGNTLFDYHIAANGALTSLGAGGFATGAQPQLLALDSTQRFAYTANAANVSVFDLSTSTIGTAVNNFGTPVGLAPSSNGRFLYTLTNTSLGRWQVSSVDGALVGGGAVTVAGAPTALTLDPGMQYAYVATANSIATYTIDPFDGFTPLNAASTLNTGIAHRAMAVDPSGRYLYAANGAANTVSAFRVNLQSGALTAIGTPYAAGNNVVAISVDYGGKYVYAVNQGSNTISAYAIDDATGALTAMAGAAPVTGNSATSIATTDIMQ